MIGEKVAAREGRGPRDALSMNLLVLSLSLSLSLSVCVCVCVRGERQSQKTSLGANKGLMTNWPSHSGVATPRIRGSTGDRQRSLGNDV